ncbi:hypothetical protein BDN67DRAFT_8497 [Paxillus ammoniavirescens]|nr:hypothetical protein BDN67DRAFT_8497 [Paxillus ammoniavirescens]
MTVLCLLTLFRECASALVCVKTDSITWLDLSDRQVSISCQLLVQSPRARASLDNILYVTDTKGWAAIPPQFNTTVYINPQICWTHGSSLFVQYVPMLPNRLFYVGHWGRFSCTYLISLSSIHATCSQHLHIKRSRRL